MTKNSDSCRLPVDLLFSSLDLFLCTRQDVTLWTGTWAVELDLTFRRKRQHMWERRKTHWVEVLDEIIMLEVEWPRLCSQGVRRKKPEKMPVDFASYLLSASPPGFDMYHHFSGAPGKISYFFALFPHCEILFIIHAIMAMTDQHDHGWSVAACYMGCWHARHSSEVLSDL